MISTFEYDSDFSELKEESKILTLFVDILNFSDRQDKIVKGRVTRQVCKVDVDFFEVVFRLSNADDVSWFVTAFLSQFHALSKTEENLLDFHIEIAPAGSSYDVTYKVYVPMPY